MSMTVAENFRRFPSFIHDFDFRSDLGAFARPQHRPPVVYGILFEQQNFKLSAGFGVDAMQARGNHARVVQHQYVAGMEKFHKILKLPVFDAIFAPMQDKQPGLVATGCWLLGNQFRRQLKMKIGGSHGR